MRKITGFLMMIFVAVSMAISVSAQTLEDVERARIDAERARIIAERVRLDEESKQFEAGLRPTTDRARIVAEKAQLDAESKRLDAESKRLDMEARIMLTREAELRVYEIKHQLASELAKLIPENTFSLTANSEFNTISLVAVPQVHEMVASIIQKYDVPKKTIEFQFFLIKANTDTEGLNDKLPEKIQTVLNEVADLTRYKNFELLDAPLLRLLDGASATIGGESMNNRYNIRLQRVRINEEVTKSQIHIGAFSVTVDSASIVSIVDVNDDEMTVIGTSRTAKKNDSIDNMIIVIVAAKIL